MIPVVLSGGSGTRLWPVSRATFPKQFCALFDESLLTKTLRRLMPLGEPGVIAVAESEALTRRVLHDLSLSSRWALFEPTGRNTAPAVGLLCHLLVEAGQGEEIVGIFPADHLVADEAAFLAAARLANTAAAAGDVVTLGIRPHRAETGYGYIELTDEVLAQGDGLAAHLAAGFREKPTRAAAEGYVASGRFLWNAGMFVFRAHVMAAAFETWMPALWSALREIRPSLDNLAEVYAGLPSESLDFGIMERLERLAVIPCDIGWSDVGSWDELARLRDSAPGVVEVEAHHNFVFAHDERTYALVGVDDLLVIDTADALLIARRGTSQQVKTVVDRLRGDGRKSATEHTFEHRPWGRFEVLRDTPRFKSKVIRVAPGQQLSYQSHQHRSEHWVIVAGHPEVVLNDRTLRLDPGQHVFIPQGARHRIRNPTSEPVEFVEVQIGSYFGEDDIVRYEDDYHRA